MEERKRKRKRRGKVNKNKGKKKGRDLHRENPAGRMQSLSQDLRVTPGPGCEGHHAIKLLPPLLDRHTHLPWILDLYIHLLKPI